MARAVVHGAVAEPTLLDVTGPVGAIVEPGCLARAELVHRQLRQFHEDYVVDLARVFAAGGPLRVAVLGDRVVGVAIYRLGRSEVASATESSSRTRDAACVV